MTTENVKDARVMIVDDEPANTLLLERLFQMVNFGECRSTNDSRDALALFQEFQPDVVLLDLSMPHLDGFEVLAILQAVISPGDYLPVLVLTADATDRTKQRALASGANDFLTKPFNASEVVLRVRNLLQTRQLHSQIRRYNENLEAVVAERTGELRKALSDLQEAQQNAIQQERLRALGTMASGVAHDFNNALSIILGFGEFVLRSCERHGEMEEEVDQMKIVITTAEDAAKIVGRLRSFYCKEANTRESPVNLNALIEQALAITEPRWKTQAMGDGIKIDIQLDLQEIPAIWGHPYEIREVLTNLIFNAVDAMPNGGTLAFSTGVEHDSVFLSVSDAGMGMTEEVRQRCLEPFFTTKGERGSGLGLSMVYGIVQRHQGKLDIISAVGQGTTFIIDFPIQTMDGEDVVHDPFDSTERPLRILVVEDQDVIRKIILGYLDESLHVAAAVSDGEEALEKLAVEKFDLVITDQAMPGMNGDRLATLIKENHPGTRVMMLTGFGREYQNGGRPPNVDLVLGKPITRTAFRAAITHVMAIGLPHPHPQDGATHFGSIADHGYSSRLPAHLHS